MITLSNKDRFIYDLEYRILDIVKEYQTTGHVEISTNGEGICLDKAKFYNLLDYTCATFNIDKSKVVIYTNNILETHNEYIINAKFSHWIYSTKKSIPVGYQPTKNKQLKTLGCFVGKINWNRLVLASWLYKNYSDKCMLTFHYRHETAQKLQSELTELNFYISSELDAINFLSICPLTIDEEFTDFTISAPAHMTVINHYSKIFLDLVTETYCMGNTFYPTEKTARPMIAKTPFIVMGPKNYLDNLKKIGFQSFDRWWNEDYDQFEGKDRINKIKQLITEIITWPQEKLHTILEEMQPILESNQNQCFIMDKKYDNKK